VRSANVFEVFSSVQGEGIFVGRRQVFVRFTGCNLACRYCDTAEAREPVAMAKLEVVPGAREFKEAENPLAVGELADWIVHLDQTRRHDAVSLTGGEPLLAAGFIAELIPLCEGRRFHLETNGTLPGELEKVIDLIDVVAMDIKLASSSGEATDLGVSREFLSIAVRRSAFVKVVVSDATESDAVVDAALVAACVNKAIPLVIQPVTPTDSSLRPPDPRQVLELQMSALRVLSDVRVIPQIHRLTGQK